ncbi:MAG: hypothetical protein QM519_09680 [Bacteroidia bacterium]|nr:hypothetical protein [Bacteroidia bacterium]
MQDPRPLYALHELPAAPEGTPILVVEGDKVADATRAVGEDPTNEALAPILQRSAPHSKRDRQRGRRCDARWKSLVVAAHCPAPSVVPASLRGE